MSTLPEQRRLGLDFSPEVIAAENLVVKACLDRLSHVRRSDFVIEEDGTMSRSVTLWSPDTRRLRRVKEFGLVEVAIPDDPAANVAIMKKGDTSKGLSAVGFQLDEHGLFHGYVSALKLPRTFNDRTRIGTLNRGDWQQLSSGLRESAAEIWTSRRVDPAHFDQLYRVNPYVGARI